MTLSTDSGFPNGSVIPPLESFYGEPFIWLLYTLAIATDVEYWWQERLPSFAAGITRVDALWFAYISTATIGFWEIIICNLKFFLQVIP